MIKKYLKSKISDISILLICSIIFISIFMLSGIRTDIFVYPFVLSGFVILLIYGWDFYKYINKYNELDYAKKKINNELSDLPETYDGIERLYQEIIEKMYSINSGQKSEFDIKSTEMVDYYSLWAHQIKTPIAAMKILIQSHMESGDIDIQYLQDMHNELFKIEQYVEMVLSYLKINSDSSDYVLKKYSVDEIVKKSIRKYSKLFIAKKIALNIEKIDIEVVTDEMWLGFVIEQIISNALKYTSKGSISIYCKNSALYIEDTGIGIAQEDIPRVCEKGFTGYNGRTDRKSTGIGLYLCKQILTKLGHKISIESQVQKGTTVMIDLEQGDLEIQ